MPRLPIWVWIGIVIAAGYLAWRFAGSARGQSYGPVRIAYNKVGSAVDWAGVPFNSPGSNPGR